MPGLIGVVINIGLIVLFSVIGVRQKNRERQERAVLGDSAYDRLEAERQEWRERTAYIVLTVLSAVAAVFAVLLIFGTCANIRADVCSNTARSARRITYAEARELMPELWLCGSVWPVTAFCSVLFCRDIANSGGRGWVVAAFAAAPVLLILAGGGVLFREYRFVTTQICLLTVLSFLSTVVPLCCRPASKDVLCVASAR